MEAVFYQSNHRKLGLNFLGVTSRMTLWGWKKAAVLLPLKKVGKDKWISSAPNQKGDKNQKQQMFYWVLLIKKEIFDISSTLIK